MTNGALQSLSSPDLLAATRALARRSSIVEADLLLHLAEIDDRKLYLGTIYPSMFAFCLEELGFSEDVAYNRMMVARAARRFPALVDALRQGKVHLAGLRLLVPHLTQENHADVLARASGKSKRRIEELIADMWPLPPIPSSIRRLVPESPLVSTRFQRLPRSEVQQGDASTAAESASLEAPLRSPPGGPASPSAGGALSSAATPAGSALRRERDRPVVAPLSADTFRIQFTASRATRDKLQQAQDLLRHRVPDGDLATIVDAALDALIAKTLKERFAVGRKRRSARKVSRSGESASVPPQAGTASVSPQPETPSAPSQPETSLAPSQPGTSSAPSQPETSSAPPQLDCASVAAQAGTGLVPPQTTQSELVPTQAEEDETCSRHIPDAIKRAVFERDGGRCTFVDDQGRRCDTTDALEFEHDEGFARTQRHQLARIRLVCRAHNQYLAEQLYGRAFMDQARGRRRARSGNGANGDAICLMP